jgi:hypothetical protein
MPMCSVCDAELKPEQKSCHVCGSNVEASASSLPASPPPLPLHQIPPIPAPPILETSVDASSDQRECPACGQRFGLDYQDEFCPCGTELRAPSDHAAPASPVDPSPPVPSESATSATSPASAGTIRPMVGTVCLVVYSDSKPRVPVRYVPLVKDVLLIGRQDAVRGDFPDLDFSSLLDESSAKKVSRRHAEILRARDSQTYRLRPLPGNTGTQVGKELASPGQEYALTDGTPIVLGGAVWMKFETIK